MAGLYTLSSKERLNSRKLIEKIFKREGELVSRFPLSFIFIQTSLPEKVPAQIMFSVSSRKVKKAHHRNYIKRLLRECYRAGKPLLYQRIERVEGRQLACCLLYNSESVPDFKTLSEKYNQLMIALDEKLA